MTLANEQRRAEALRSFVKFLGGTFLPESDQHQCWLGLWATAWDEACDRCEQIAFNAGYEFAARQDARRDEIMGNETTEAITAAIRADGDEKSSAAQVLGQSHCPKCDCTDVHAKPVDIEGSYARQECNCPECDTEWTDWYRYDGYKLQEE